MYRLALVFAAGLAAGALVLYLLLSPSDDPARAPQAADAEETGTGAGHEADEDARPERRQTAQGDRSGTPAALSWQMASNFPGRLVQYGALGRRFVEKVGRASGGEMRIEFNEPGELVPPENCLDAVAEGSVDACWSTPTHWYGRESALAIFGGAPFGPSTREYVAWYYYGGGKQLLSEIYARHGVTSILCGVAAPEAGGWFKEEITGVEDLQGLKMRFFGLGARVMAKLGVETFRINGDEIIGALRDGRVDAAEYSMPAIDAGMGFEGVAGYYYFPGWHQQTTILEFVVSRESWQDLEPAQQAIIEHACGDGFRDGLAEGEALQARALREMRARGVELRRWPPDVLSAMQSAWVQVVNEEREANTTFKRVWDAYTEFRETYKFWDRLGYLDPAEASGDGREDESGSNSR